MLLRKLAAFVCPLLICLFLCLAFGWLDGVLQASFFSYLIKGLALGAGLALIPPLAGVKARLTGLSKWLLAGAALLIAALTLQYLQSIGTLNASFIPVRLNGQTVLIESAVLGYMLAACAVCRGH